MGRAPGGRAWLKALAASQALGWGLVAQEPFNPGVPPVLASPDLPGLEPTGERARRTPGSDYFLGNVPYTGTPAPYHGGYNFRVGNLSGSFSAAASVEYTDNVLLTAQAVGPTDDVIITPSVGMRLHYPFSEYSELDVQFGVGYAFYMNHQELNRLNASFVPESLLSYRMIAGEVKISFYNRLSVPSGYQNQPELRGTGTAESVDLNRISNRTGTSASWAVNEDLSMTAGYGFTIERGLSDSYAQLDRNTHSFEVAAYQVLGPSWTTGISGSYSFNEYIERLQNDTHSTSIGPLLAWKASEFLSVSAQIGYSVVTADQTSIAVSGSDIGVIDTSDFSGLTYQLGITHRINKLLSHSLSVGDSVNGGLGSNYTESFQVGYGFSWILNPLITVHTAISYTNFKQSQAQRIYIAAVSDEFQYADQGEYVTFSIGTGYSFTQKLRGGLQYTHDYRSSDTTGYAYHVNRVFLTLSYSF